MLKDILILGIILLLTDSTYLYLSSSYFNNLVKSIQNSPLKINYLGAILCYISLVFSLYYFVISKKQGLLDAFILGLTTYAVFEYTNYAIFKKWSFFATIFDSIWGGLLFTITTYVFYLLKNYF